MISTECMLAQVGYAAKSAITLITRCRGAAIVIVDLAQPSMVRSVLAYGALAAGVMVAAMSLPSILFIPDQFGDYRLWSDIPDRLQGRAQAIHFDQHDLPWMSGNGEFLEEARQLAPGGAFHIVAANGGAARFGFALAEAGLARGLVLFQPSLDSLPDDVHLDRPSEVDPDHVLDPYMPVLSVLDEPDPGRRREILLEVVRATAGQDLEPAGLELLLAMYSDHADEIFAFLQTFAAEGKQAEAAEPTGADEPVELPPWLEQPWINRLANLAVPVTTVVSARGRAIAEAIARRAKDAEIVVAGANAGLEPAADRARAADAILRMLRRIG
jgi:hypothetical protein